MHFNSVGDVDLERVSAAQGHLQMTGGWMRWGNYVSPFSLILRACSCAGVYSCRSGYSSPLAFIAVVSGGDVDGCQGGYVAEALLIVCEGWQDDSGGPDALSGGGALGGWAAQHLAIES